MFKKIFLGALLTFVIIFSCTNCFAEDNSTMLDNMGNNIKNAVNNIENGVEDAARNISGASKDATENISQKANSITNNLMDGSTANYDANTNYNATRTDTTMTNSNTFMGMDANMWTWLRVGIAAIAIIALIWYYMAGLRSSDNYKD